MKTYSKEELSIIWIDSFIGLEYKHKFKIYEFVKTSNTISEGLKSAREYIVSNIGEKEYNTMISSANQTYLDYILEELNRKEMIAITYLSKDYPNSLLNIEIKPFVLYAKGKIELLKEEIFAIVGSRKNISLSLTIAKEYARDLLDNFCLITGIAEGVDSEVLKSALDNNGKVISVIAGGIDNVYPSSNKDLLEKVAKNGLVLSEYPPKVVPKPYYFPIRNRIFAALAKGVLIVSGAIKSGTLYTAEYAGEFGKDIFAIPYSVGIKSGEGCNELIKRGAILVDSVQDILSFYGIDKKQSDIELTEEEKEIMKVLSYGQMHIEKLSSELSKQAFQIMPTLSIMEIKGLIVKSGNFYGLVHSYSEE